MRTLNQEHILVLAIVFSAPFFITNVFLTQALYYPILGVLLALALLLILTKPQKKIPVSYCLFLTFTFCALSLVGIGHASDGNNSEVARYIFGLSIKIVFLYVLYLSYVDVPRAFPLAFIKMTYILCWLVIVFALLHYSGLWPLTPKIYHYSETKAVYNFYLTFSSSIRVIDGFIYPRLSSYLDEPGSFALLCSTALLLAYKIGHVEQKVTLVIVIGGMLSFSLAFYIFLFLYAFLDAKIERILATIFIMIIAYSLYSFVPTLASMGDLVINRLEYSDGNFSGDNRFRYSRWPDNLVFGDGLVGQRDSIINEFRNWGIVGVVTNYAPLLFAFLFGNFRTKKVIIIFFILMTQRPVIDKLYLYFPLVWMAMDAHLRRSNET